MANIIEYTEQELRTLLEKPFSEVDSLVLSELSYLHLDAVLEQTEQLEIRDLLRAEAFDALFRDVRDAASDRKLLFALAASPRFRQIGTSYFAEHSSAQREEQFAAVTFFLDGHTACIVFRGTDSTLIGWKEDFTWPSSPVYPHRRMPSPMCNRLPTYFPGNWCSAAIPKAVISPCMPPPCVRRMYRTASQRFIRMTAPASAEPFWNLLDTNVSSRGSENQFPNLL